MSAQPEALRLADELEGNQLYGLQRRCRDEAAAELRRLHAANQDLLDWFHAAKSDKDKAETLLRQALESLETDDWQKKLQAAIDIRTYLTQRGATK